MKRIYFRIEHAVNEKYRIQVAEHFSFYNEALI